MRRRRQLSIIERMSSTITRDDSYALGRSAAETDRLVLQHQIYGPATRQFFVAAGVTRGMRVLDLGSGAGDVALLLADLVGPEEAVVGIDANHEILDRARDRARAAGRSNIGFLIGDLATLDVGDEPIDAVVGRWILMYLPDPVDLVRRATRRVRPGGVVAFQESVLGTPPVPYPPTPVHSDVARWLTPPADAPGPEVDMGLKLFRTFHRAGLEATRLRVDGAMGGGPDWPGYAYLAATVRSLLPFPASVGTVNPDDVDINTVEERLRQEILAVDGVQVLPTVVGAWARVR